MVKYINGNGSDNPVKRGFYIGVITLFLSIVLTGITNMLLTKLGLVFALLVLLVIISIGVLFDMIGVAVTAANESSFHSMAAKKVYGANLAFRLVRHADKVSSFCSDVVGDICGTISGAAAALIVYRWLINDYVINPDTVSLLMVAFIAAITVGGKSAGKSIAIDNCREITYLSAKSIAWIENYLNFTILPEKGKVRRR